MTWTGFECAFKKVMKHEGGYSHDPDDHGAETYMGISRRYHPDWNGWIYIDDVKERSTFRLSPKILQDLVRIFYKER